MVYRPVAGLPRRVPFHRIVRVRHNTGPGPVGTLLTLDLEAYDILSWRLGVYNEYEAMDRLGRATGIPWSNGRFDINFKEATATGQKNHIAGIYRSKCGGDEHAIAAGQTFPQWRQVQLV